MDQIGLGQNADDLGLIHPPPLIRIDDESLDSDARLKPQSRPQTDDVAVRVWRARAWTRNADLDRGSPGPVQTHDWKSASASVFTRVES